MVLTAVVGRVGVVWSGVVSREVVWCSFVDSCCIIVDWSQEVLCALVVC